MSVEQIKLTFKEKVGYGLGDTASNLYFQMYINFLLFFYTDVFGIPAAAAGTLFMLSRFWDAVNDPMMGIIADRTNTKWGKFRPYLLWIMGPLAVIGVLMFTTPNLSVQGKIAYAYVTYILMMMAYTAINIPYSALLGVLSSDSQERTSASTYRFVLAFVGALVVQGATLPLVYTTGNDPQGFALSNNTLLIKEVDNKTSRYIVTANDGISETETEFLINIKKEGERPPVVKNPLAEIVLQEGFGSEAIDLSNVFSDPDKDKLLFATKVNDGDAVDVNITNQTLNIIEKNIGHSEISLIANDTNYGQKNTNFSVYVNEANNQRPQRINPLQDQVVDIENETHRLPIDSVFNDANGDDLNYTVYSKNGAAISAAALGTELEFKLNKVGISEIVLTADDLKGGVARDTFFVKCRSKENDPPSIYKGVDNVELAMGFNEYAIDISDVFQDLDGDAVSFAVKKVDVAKGFQFTLVIFGILACILFYFTFAWTKERVQPPTEQQSSLKNDLKDLIRNRPWMMLLFMGIFSLGYIIIRVGTIMYYFKYYIENELLASLFMVTGTLAVIAGVACTGFLSRIFGKKKLYIIVMALSSLLTMIFYFIPKEQIVLVFAVNIIIQFVMAPQAPLLWAMYADTADYSEWKNKRRATGLVFSAATFAQKFGMALGGGIAGWLLAMFRFQPNVQQAPDTLNGIKLMMSFIPAIGSIAATFVALFYELDDKTMKQIELDLQKRKK